MGLLADTMDLLADTMVLLVAVDTTDILFTTCFAKHFKGVTLKHVDLTDGLVDLAGYHVAL